MSKANATASASASGVGFFGLLTLLFIGLKLTGHINWSWVWVLAPMWIPAGLTVAVIALILTVAAIAALVGLAMKGK